MSLGNLAKKKELACKTLALETKTPVLATNWVPKTNRLPAIVALPDTKAFPHTLKLASPKTSAPMETLFNVGCTFNLLVLFSPVPPRYFVTLVGIYYPFSRMFTESVIREINQFFILHLYRL